MLGTYKPSLLSRHVESLSQLQLVDAMVLHGMILQLNGKFKEAAGLYHEAMVRIDNSNVYTSQQFQNPFNLAKVPQAWEMYAALKCEMGDIPAALDVVKRNALEHEHPAAFRLLATLAKQHNNLPLADYELYLTKAAMAADPIACCLLGQFYVEGYLENVKNVEGSVKSYFRPPPKSPTERFYRKYPHRELLNKAIDWYEIANNYGYEWAALPLAWIFREQGNLKEGMYYLDIAAKVQKCAHEAEQFRKVFNTRDLKVPFKEYILNKRPF
ncbi:hypothetical protein FQN50_000641 [Emmonsiellopsis sp. PD_5]|nr:hypothetical protein FQN50_000641 [Emmonsiellopsis sp. PD_5]